MEKSLRDVLKDNPDVDLQDIVVVHGAASGADYLAGEVARSMGMQIEEHPADWSTYGKSAGPKRNVHMVRLGADICLAFPSSSSKGTFHCMQEAYLAGIPVINCTGVSI